MRIGSESRNPKFEVRGQEKRSIMEEFSFRFHTSDFSSLVHLLWQKQFFRRKFVVIKCNP
jgi:hypothetical protein